MKSNGAREKATTLHVRIRSRLHSCNDEQLCRPESHGCTIELSSHAVNKTKEKSVLSNVGQQYAEEVLAKHKNPNAKAQMLELMRDF